MKTRSTTNNFMHAKKQTFKPILDCFSSGSFVACSYTSLIYMFHSLWGFAVINCCSLANTSNIGVDPDHHLHYMLSFNISVRANINPEYNRSSLLEIMYGRSWRHGWIFANKFSLVSFTVVCFSCRIL